MSISRKATPTQSTHVAVSTTATEATKILIINFIGGLQKLRLTSHQSTNALNGALQFESSLSYVAA